MLKLLVHSALVLPFVLAGAPTLCRCQVDSLGDCFPLSVGNRWTYRYYFEFNENLRGWTDSGLASYTVVGKSSFIDSTLWSVREERNLTRCDWKSGGLPTYSSISDTSYFGLLEEYAGMHRLYRQMADSASLWYSVFPFPRDVSDTTAIYRYRVVDSTQSSMQEIAFPATEPFIRYTFTFRRDSGLVRLAARNLITMQGYERADHELLEGTVTDVTHPYQVHTSTQVTLSHGYPNPFNPTTTINFALPKSSEVRLNVYDMLGREVSVLVNERRDAGVHEVKFDGSGLASGIYLYRLQAGSFVQTRKLVLLR